jgi:hypothetical protein
MVFRHLCALVFLYALAGCSTPYGKAGLTGGFTEKELQPGIWRIVFSGNGYTTQETAQTYWLYRCAEIALQQGYDGFEILSDVRFSSTWTGTSTSLAAQATDKNICQVVYIPMYYDDSNKPSVGGDIRLLRAPIAERPPKIFDAVKLKSVLDPIVNGKKCGGLGNVCPHVHTYLLPLDDPLRQQTPAPSVGEAPKPAQ